MTQSILGVTKRDVPKRRVKGHGKGGPVESKGPSRRKVVADLGSGSLPLYKKIKLEITSALSNGKLEPGKALPTEEQWSAQYGVSVGTVRRAMSELVAEHVLIRQ